MATGWQDGVREGLVRDLLRPTLLARDEQSALVGELFARGAWPELRLPLLAAWAQQWDQTPEGAPESLPIVHPRPPEPTIEPVRTVIQVQATTIERTAPATPAPAPRVRARTAAAAPAPAEARPVPPPPSTSLTHRIVVEHHDTGEPADPPRPRLTAADLPRVVAAFRPDLAARLETPRPQPPAPRDPAARETVREPTTIREPTARESTTRESAAIRVPARDGAPATQPPTPEHPRAASHSPVPEDMPRATPPHAPRATAHPPMEAPAPALVHPSPPPTDPTAAPHTPDQPVLSTMPSRTVTTPRPTATSDAPATMSPRTSVPAQPTPHSEPPELVHPTTSPTSNLSQVPASSTRTAVVAARTAPTPPRARPLTAPATRPRAEARWTDVPDPLARPFAPAAPRNARRDALPHPALAQPHLDLERPAAPAPRPVPSTTLTTPPPAAAPAPPQLDIDALVETVERRLARGLERSRALRRALR